MLPALLRTRSTAHALLQRASRHAYLTTEAPTLVVPNITLPTPEPITSQLTARGVDSDSAQQISSAMMRVALLLKKDFESGIQRMLQAPKHPTLEHNQSRIRSTFTAIYLSKVNGWTSHILNVILPRAIDAQRRLTENIRTTVDGSHRKPYKPVSSAYNHRSQRIMMPRQSVTRVLEDFFEKNAYPSKLETAELAATCKLAYKQIKIWVSDPAPCHMGFAYRRYQFQNRRRRSKKDVADVETVNRETAVLRELEDAVVDSMLPLASEEEDGTSCGDTVRLGSIAVSNRYNWRSC